MCSVEHSVDCLVESQLTGVGFGGVSCVAVGESW